MTVPTGPHHAEWVDASGSYVLGAMPDDEALAYAAHLEVCAACRAEVAELQPVAAALPASVMPVSVPAAIGERVMAEVRREAQLLAAAGEGADRVAPPARVARRRGWWRWPVPALAAAALLLGLAVGLGAAGVIGGRDDHTVAMRATGRHAPQGLGDRRPCPAGHGRARHPRRRPSPPARERPRLPGVAEAGPRRAAADAIAVPPAG
jgi:hypothetical protein